MYDGYAFTPFVHDPSDASSISDNAIRTIYEDRRGDLWIGTNTGGLNCLDLAARTFRHFRYDEADPSSLSHDSVYAIAEDASGALWVGTQRGLNRMDLGTGRFTRFDADPGRPGSLASAYVTSLLVDGEDRLWVGTLPGGLARLDRATGTFTVYRHDAADLGSLGDDSVFALFADRPDELFVGTGTGLDRMNVSTGRFERYGRDPKNLPGGSSMVTGIAPGLPGKLWIGTYGGGVNELDAASGTVRVLRRTDPGGVDKASDRVVAIMSDRGGTLWIGTWGAGLDRLRRSALLFASASGDVPIPAGTTDIDLSSMARDAQGRLWVGTASGELLRFDPKARTWNRYGGTEGQSVMAITEARGGAIWAGTFTGLVRLDPEHGTSRTFHHDASDPQSLGPGYVRSLLQDGQGRLWVGTGEGGLQQVDDAGRVLARFRPRPDDPSSLSDDYVTALHEDRRGTLWVGTRSGGLNAFDPATGRAIRHQPVPGKPDSLSHHSVVSIFEDSKGRLWVGTGGGGLNRVDRPEGGGPASFTRFTTADGLVDNNVMGILEDDDGSLWLSTKRGLSRFDPSTKAFANVLVSDGLPSAEFAPGVAARFGSTLCFGSVRWLASVAAGAPFPEREPSPVIITSIRNADSDLKGDEPAWRLKQLKIPYGGWLSIELAVLDFGPEVAHAYAYTLGGAGASWLELGPRRAITFTDLAPGTYRFRAKGRNERGVWSETAQPLTITVVPPFWMTAWFKTLAGLGLAGAVVLVHQVRTAKLKQRNRELVDLHTQRERARADLNTAYDRLRLLAQRLEAAKEEERKTIARELHDELGPTLTAVVINLQLLKDTPDVERRSRRIADTVEIVDRMIQRVREISLDLRPPLLDEMGLVTALRGYLETLAARSGIAIEVRAPGTVEGLPPEVEIVAFRVVQESVTNVIRHAGATRAVVTVGREDGLLLLSIEDDGKGFDVERRLEIAATGQALGLLGMRERVQLLAGTLSIASQPAGGTRVSAVLPVEARA